MSEGGDNGNSVRSSTRFYLYIYFFMFIQSCHCIFNKPRTKNTLSDFIDSRLLDCWQHYLGKSAIRQIKRNKSQSLSEK